MAVPQQDTAESVSLIDKIDWSKWTTVEGQETVTRRNIKKKLQSTTEAKYQKPEFDWSMWTTTKGGAENIPENTVVLTEPSVKVIGKEMNPPTETGIPRRSKNKIQRAESRLSKAKAPQRDTEVDDNQKILLATNMQSNNRNSQQKTTRRRLKGNIMEQVDESSTNSGLDWSRWSETSSNPEPDGVTNTDKALLKVPDSAVPNFLGWPW